MQQDDDNNIENSYLFKQIENKAVLVFLVMGKRSDNGMMQYCYLACNLKNTIKLRKAMKRGNFRAEEFGTVIKWGIGNPPQEVMSEMTEKYGFNHENMLTIGADES